MLRQTILKYTRYLVPALLMTHASLAQEAHQIPEGFTLPQGDLVFSSSALQAELDSTFDLGALAQENSALGERASSFGFSAKSDEANVFLVGVLYSESLAFLGSGNFPLAEDRLEALQQQFIRLGVPSSLYSYVTKVLNLVSKQQYSNEALLDMLSLFQPFFEDYASNRSDDFLILFRAGSWLSDLSLAAAVGNTPMLLQQAHLEYIAREMDRLDAPPGVGDALKQISEVTAKDEISTRDLQSVIGQIKRIQSILG
jgi:hypothetical protein